MTVSSWEELIEAVELANLNGEPDTITLTGTSADFVAGAGPASALPPIVGELHIVGPGSDHLTIDLAMEQVVGVVSASDVSISGVSIINGAPHGLHVLDSANVVLDDVAVEGAVDSGLRFVNSSGAIRNSWFAANGGEGVAVVGTAPVEVDIFSVTATGNARDGINVTVDDGARITMADVEATQNGASGLTVETRGAAEVSVTRLVGVGNNGLGATIVLMGWGSASVTDSSLNENDQGGLGTVLAPGRALTVSGVTAAGNSGTGLFASVNFASSLSVVNSTFSGNTYLPASGCAGGVSVFADVEATVEFAHSSVVDNVSHPLCAQARFLPQNEVVFSHNIFAGTPKDLDILGAPASLVLDHNLVQSVGADATLEGWLAAGTDNLVGVDPMLGSLADNGGHTLTHLPAESSPVVDAGVTSSSSLPATDQRGEARLAGAAVDLGAVELPRGLAATGVEEEAVWPLLAGGGVLLLLGAALVVFRVRRDRSQAP